MIGIRTCKSDMTSYGGFVWPGVGEKVVAPDWDPKPQCGNGLHFLLPYQNKPGSWYDNVVYMAIDVDPQLVVDLDGKSKAPEAIVRFKGTRCELYVWLQSHGHAGPWYQGVLIAGDYDTARVGAYGIAIVGVHGHALAGNSGRAIAGDCGVAVSGSYGSSKAGRYGYAEVGARGHAMASLGGCVSAGTDGIVSIAYYNNARRRSWRTGYIGESGLQPNVQYKLGANNKFVKA
jgi:hypothetical protein